jgi:hypothetical protein
VDAISDAASDDDDPYLAAKLTKRYIELIAGEFEGISIEVKLTT